MPTKANILIHRPREQCNSFKRSRLGSIRTRFTALRSADERDQTPPGSTASVMAAVGQLQAVLKASVPKLLSLKPFKGHAMP